MRISMTIAIAALALVGCTGERDTSSTSAPATSTAQPAATATKSGPVAVPAQYSEGGGFSGAFYGEALQDGRIYLFGQKKTFEDFLVTKQPIITKSKTFIGAGPNYETVIAETDKESPAMTERVLKQFKKRYGLN